MPARRELLVKRNGAVFLRGVRVGLVQETSEGWGWRSGGQQFVGYRLRREAIEALWSFIVGRGLDRW